MIALINLKYESYKITNFRRQEHLGIGYIAANARKHGYAVEVINAQFDDIETADVINRILQLRPKVLGLSLYEMQLQQSIDFLNAVKQELPEVIIVVGGHYASFNSKELLSAVNSIDIVVQGEGEISFVDLLHEIYCSTASYTTQGLCFRKDGKIVDLGFSPYVKDLDSLSLPVRSNLTRQNFITNISAGRGCPGNCSFCSTNALDKRQKVTGLRIRNVYKVVDEIEELVKNNNAYHFFFTDDNFIATELVYPNWITEFSQEIKKRNLNIIFNFDCRVDNVQESYFRQLKEVGLIGVFLGVESNSEKTLKLYNKLTSSAINAQAVRILKKLRIDFWLGNIMFHPLTTLEDIEEDIKFLSDINYVLYFNYANPISLLAGKLNVYKGTPIYDELSRQSLVQNNGLTAQYSFREPKVQCFFTFLSLWKQKIEPFVAIDTIFLIELANKKKNAKLAAQLHTLSRRYMKLDFDTFKQSLEYIKNNDIYDQEVFFAQILNEKQGAVTEIYAKLNDIRDQLLWT